ncbi:MAG: DUF1566 domain-containing protein [Desulfatibacillum sp.]|nr:DUF1566 domain-containing protein [Desulfatibacillum sp.]
MKARLTLSLSLCLLLVLPAFCFASALGLPQTGQKICYAVDGSIIDCSGTGQDGQTQAGVAWPGARFTNNGDGTITDNLTGLMWLQNANIGMTTVDPADGAPVGNCILLPQVCSGYMKWQEALDFVAGINAGTYDLDSCADLGLNCVEYSASYSDWRLPNMNELNSLLNPGASDPTAWLTSQGFENVSTYPYWSSTTDNQNTNDAWVFDFQADVSGSNSQMIIQKTNGYCLTWAVRSGPTGTNNPAWPANVQKTGQTLCYDDAGTVRNCAGTGEDGEYQRGITWPSPRFTDNSDGTITDNLTGLMWLQDFNCLGGTGNHHWDEALTYINNFNATPSTYSCTSYTANYGDWRLPNRTELVSLIDWSIPTASCVIPSGHPFLNVAQNWYWSSTTYAPTPASVWSVNMRFGNIPRSSKTNDQYVTAVRGQSIAPIPPKVGDVNGDDSVTEADAMILLQILNGIDPGFAPDMDLADANADGVLNLEDALFILKDVGGHGHLFTKEEMEEFQKVEDLLNLASSSLVDSQGGWEDLGSLNEVLTELGIQDVSGGGLVAVAESLRGILAAASECGTFSREVNTFTFTFSGAPACNSVSGVLIITPTYSAETGILFEVECQNLQTTTCTINGESTTKVSVNGNQLIITQDIDNLTVCGTALNGTIAVTYNIATMAVESVTLTDVVYSYSVDGVPVTVTCESMTYNGGAQTFNGTMEIQYGDDTYTLTITNLVIDQTCGVPTGGTITVNSMTFDFSQTTCENPTVSTTVMGIPVTMNLDDAIAYFNTL